MSEPTAWPPAIGLTTKIVPRKNAILTLSHSTVVHAPAALVFETVLQVSDYAKWNTWVPGVRVHERGPGAAEAGADAAEAGRLQIGDAIEFEVVMNADKPNKVTRTQLKVVDISTPSAPTSYLPPDLLVDPSFTADLSKVYRVSWKDNGGMHGFAPKLERFHEVIPRGENECEVRTWEIMTGMLSRVVKLMYEDTLKGKVALWCEDLKRHCDKVHRERAAT